MSEQTLTSNNNFSRNTVYISPRRAVSAQRRIRVLLWALLALSLAASLLAADGGPVQAAQAPAVGGRAALAGTGRPAAPLDQLFNGAPATVPPADVAPAPAAPLAAGDERWDNRFPPTGPDEDPSAMTFGGGKLYVALEYGVDGVVLSWDGVTWSVLGSGVHGWVFALAVSGSDLYVGGEFDQIGGVNASNVARWDGSNWHPLGSGIQGWYWGGSVNALAVIGSDLYAGGEFYEAGGTRIHSIAKWNGKTWSALGSGIGTDLPDACVNALAVSGSELYVGGWFHQAGGVSANNVARWSGTSWSALDSGVNAGGSEVHSLAVSNGDLYAGGEFTQAGGVSANHVAR